MSCSGRPKHFTPQHYVRDRFSSSSEAALPYAIGLSRRYDSLLNIVSVVPAEICDNAQPPDPFYFRHSAENKMANLVRSDLFQGIKHQELVKEGEEGVPQVLSELMQKNSRLISSYWERMDKAA